MTTQTKAGTIELYDSSNMMSRGGAQDQPAAAKALVRPAVPEKTSQKRRTLAALMQAMSKVHALGHPGRSEWIRGRPRKVSSTECQSSGLKTRP